MYRYTPKNEILNKKYLILLPACLRDKMDILPPEVWFVIINLLSDIDKFNLLSTLYPIEEAYKYIEKEPNILVWKGEDFKKDYNYVIIHHSITNIGEEAFNNYDSVISITIPESITSIELGAFSYCSGLTSVTIPDSVTSIGNGAFLIVIQI